MKVAIYNPYLDTLGGGERYTFSFALVFVSLGYDVFIQWREKKILEKVRNKFGLNVEGLKVVEDIKRGDGFDICFWVSDGSIPLLRARKNFLHFQIPFKDVNGRSLINKMKFFRINKVICNSYFTKKFIDEEYGVDSLVIYPPIDILSIKPRKKENMILCVSRFSQLTQAKRQDVLVDAFKKILKKGIKGWRLILAGGTEVGVDDYLSKLKKSIKGYPIEIIENPNFDKLISLYARSKIFWSASGFGINENKYPQKVEHFGMAVIESMSAGCVPLVYNAGGHKEIVKDSENGYLWLNVGDLVKKTHSLILDKNKLKLMASASLQSSKKFSYERFEKDVKNLL